MWTWLERVEGVVRWERDGRRAKVEWWRDEK